MAMVEAAERDGQAASVIQRLDSRMANRLLTVIGRLGICYLFLQAGFYHLTFGADHTVAEMMAKGIPFAPVLNAVAMVTSMSLALALLFNFKPRWSALGLALYTVTVSTCMNAPWLAHVSADEKVYFMKDMAIFGALLCLFCALRDPD